MLIMAGLLGGLSAWLEIVFVGKTPILKRLNERSKVVGIVLSIAISWVIATIFGMAGLITGLAAMISTFVTEPWWHFNRKAKSDPKTARQLDEALDSFMFILKCVKWAILTMMAPIFLLLWIRRTYHKVAASGSEKVVTATAQ